MDGYVRLLCTLHRFPEPEPEYRFHRVRRWRFDFAWPEHKVALEIEGGVWTRGRHVRPHGFLRDIEKYNWATALGWRVLRATPQMVSDADPRLIDWLERVLHDTA